MKKLLLTLFITLTSLSIKCQNLPTLFVTTPDSAGITSKEKWTSNCVLRITDETGCTLVCDSATAVKGRGHSSWAKPKKPFDFKFQEKTGVLGMKPNKRWCVLANFMDHSLLRNELALRAARATSLDWTPQSRIANVEINGKPQGCYLIVSRIDVGKGKVNIDKRDGVLLEIDVYGDTAFMTRYRHLPVNVREPKKLSAKKLKQISKYINKVESIIYGSDRSMPKLFEKYLDLDSYVDWWLVHELCQNAEPNGPRSVYVHRDKKGKLSMGPVWDFDLAFINVGLDAGGDLRPARLNRTDVRRLTVDSIYNGRALWFDRLISSPTFVRRLGERWHKLKPKFEALLPQLDALHDRIAPSAIADQQLCGDKDPAKFDNQPSFEASFDNLKRTYARRIEVLDEIFSHDLDTTMRALQNAQ